MDLPYENVYEIFSMLPAKTICKIKTVCKPFFEYSEENHFKAKQAQNLSLKDDTCFIIQPDKYHQMYYGRIEVHQLPGEEPYSGVSHMRLLSKSMRVLASDNGLLLCCTNNNMDQIDLFVCNPVTQTSFPIPNSGHYQGDNVNVKIVLECYKDGYNLILFEASMDSDWRRSYRCKVYQSKEAVWKTKKQKLISGTRSLKFEMPVIHNGAVHFISDTSCHVAKSSKYYKPYIVSYDLESGMSTMVKLPVAAVKGFEYASCKMGIFKWGKVWTTRRSICLVRSLKGVFTVWSMEEVGERVIWRMVLRVRVKALVGMIEKNPKVKGFMVTNGDLLIFATERKVYSCGLNERYMEIEEICKQNCGFRPTFISYSNTLRPTC